MKKQSLSILIVTIGILLCAIAHVSYAAMMSYAPNPAPAPQNPSPVEAWPRSKIMDLLDWLPTTENMCGGFYREPEIVLKYPNPLPIKQEQTTITADQPAYFSQTGTSILRGNVTVTQLGRQLTADTAYIYRDPQTGKVNAIDLFGNVHIYEAGKVAVAQQAHINLVNQSATWQNAVYRFSKATEKTVLNAWGTVRQGMREASGVFNLHHATYTTCPPQSNTWKVEASHLRLDKESGVGTATNSVLAIKDIPIFYVPYFSFPLDNRRKSGFLFPTFGYSDRDGVSFGLPYYLNLAPNYDATITPVYISKRGAQGNLLARYLTEDSRGKFNISFLPNDNEFRGFQSRAPFIYNNPSYDVYLSRLRKDSPNRTAFSYVDSTIFDPHWSANVSTSYVSDDYYLQDFGSTPNAVNTDQLLNQGDLNYQSENWRFLGRLQGYQTLHPINEAPTQNQYAHLPELDLLGDFPNQKYGLDYQLSNQFVYFDQERNFVTGAAVPTGGRLHIAPSISLPLANMGGYFTPQFTLDNRFYDLQNQVPNQPSSITRVIPMFDIDTGLFFDRKTEFAGHDYRQTLEPRLFYLFVPTVNQTALPGFDTTLPPFNYGQLFQINRFVGLDRIGDANQVAFGLTSRFIDDVSGEEKMYASAGGAYFIQHHQVCDITGCSDDPTVHERISPLVGELGYHLNPAWRMISDMAWDPNRAQVNNTSINLFYTPDERRIFNVGYQFVRGGDVLTGTTGSSVDTQSNGNSLSRINLAAAYPFTQHWSAVGDWNYNITHGHNQAYFYGAQYDTCCWAMRFIVSRTIIAQNQFGATQFRPNFYIQFQLKGLGNIGNSSPGSLLTTMLPGYRDIFS